MPLPRLSNATLLFATLSAITLGVLIGSAVIKKRNDFKPAERGRLVDVPVGTTMPDQLLTFRLFDGATAAPNQDGDGNPLPSAAGENIVRATAPLKQDVVTIDVPARGQLEYKAIMQRGASLVYHWRADGPIYFDFHAHTDDNTSGFYTRYANGESIADGGSIVAAYAGQHGWYFENAGRSGVTVTLTVAGFYDELIPVEL
ncbi:MAG: hypothetical protein AAF610_00705 [Pseudomonadota bacterium]